MLVLSPIKIDLRKQTLREAVYAVQNDSNTRGLELTLVEGESPWNIPTGTTAAISFRKPDGTSGLYDTLPDGVTKAVEITQNKVTAIFAPQVLTCPGRVDVSLILFDSLMNRLGTFPIPVFVSEDPSAGQGISNDYYNFQTLGELNEALERHIQDKDNPHGVTAEQVGARPKDWTPNASDVGAAPAEFIRHSFATNGDVVDLLLIDDVQYGQANKPQRIYTGDVTALLHRPVGFPTSGAYIGQRIIDWYEEDRYVVTIHEAYPVPGRIWVNHYNVSAWSGWSRIDTADKFAPSGHGLGGNAEPKSWSEIDSLITNGKYQIGNINQNINGINVVSACVEVVYYGYNYGKQLLHTVETASGSGASYTLERSRGYGGWEPWECKNPPMETGIEYRTTERFFYNGVYFPVYTMEIYCGPLPPSGYRVHTFPDAVNNALVITDWSGYIDYWGVSLPSGDPGFNVYPAKGNGGIVMKTDTDRSANGGVFITLKYIKAT